MPTQQPEQTFTPNEAAELTGVAAHNVRRWSEYHAAHLSSTANPATGIARRFTGRDIEVLRHIDSLRKQGLTVPVINEQLKGLTFAQVDSTIDAADSEALEASTDAPNAIESAPAVLMVVVDTMRTMQAEIEALKATKVNDRRLVRDGVFMFLAGGVTVLLFVLIVVVIVDLWVK